jgi:sterol desaturase/sphingolipid hydroxylase (fatty acid hydroxylase superfamily)
MSVLRTILRVALWPALVLGTTLAFVVSFERGFAEVGLAGVPLVVILILFALELILPERSGEGSGQDPQLWNDAFHGVLSQGVGNPLGQAVFVFAAALLAGEISDRWGGNLWPAEASLWIQIPLLVVLADGLDYWRHRLMHTSSWLWPVHALHHNGDRLNVLKAARAHFLDMVVRSLLCFAPLVLIGVSGEVVLAYAAAVTVVGPVAHANVSLQVPAFLHRFVMTPHVHRIHHARPQALSCSNYANLLPLWDILFGSHEHPGEQPHLDYGIEEDTIPSDILGQPRAPFVAWRSAWRQRRARVHLLDLSDSPGSVELSKSVDRPTLQRG